MLRRKVKSFFLHTKVFYKPTILARTFTNNKLDIIVKSSHPSIDYPNISIDQYVWKNVSKWSDKTAIVDGITKRSINYGQLRDQCRTLAVHLQSTFKLNFGDTIGICLANSIEFPIITLAASECGLTTTTINPIYTAGKYSKAYHISFL
jgi:acyl-CoA synthetase (AMP-forming)/AMP-acid ligase II